MSTDPLRVALVAFNAPHYRSLALAYLQAHAQADRRLQGRVAFITLDLSTTDDPWWAAYRLVGMQPDVVGLTVTCWSARAVYDLCAVVKKSLPGVRIVLGGPEVSPIAEQVLRDHPEVDAVVRGEGEETFAELLAAYSRDGSVSRVEGVTARRDGEIFSAPDRALISDLDSIPSPYLAGVLAPSDDCVYVETYRGCPYDCGYCFEGKGYGRIRHFSEARVASEVQALFNAGVRSLSFVDPVFNLTGERLRWLSDLLAPFAERGLTLHTVEVDIERIGAEEARLLKRAGVEFVETGPQSVGQAALSACHRRFDEQRFRAGVRALKEVGIGVECDLIVGLPGDTCDDVLNGMRFVLENDPGMIQMSTLHVLPGTDLWERSAEHGLEFMNEAPHELVRTRQLPFDDLRRLEALGYAVTEVYRARLQSPGRCEEGA